jgi:hypothetical protein
MLWFVGFSLLNNSYLNNAGLIVILFALLQTIGILGLYNSKRSNVDNYEVTTDHLSFKKKRNKHKKDKSKSSKWDCFDCFIPDCDGPDCDCDCSP